MFVHKIHIERDFKNFFDSLYSLYILPPITNVEETWNQAKDMIHTAGI